MYQEEAQTNHRLVRLVKEKHPKKTMESINLHIQCSAYATTPVLSSGFSTWNPIPDRGQLPVSFHHLAAGEASLHMVPKMVGYITPITLGVDIYRW